jgi:membrane protease YdiL (CAAX protease family)
MPVAENPSEGPLPIAPIAISSVVFAALHKDHGLDPIPLFFLAVALGYLYQRTHRMLPSLVLHAVFNAFSLSLLPLQLSGGEAG